MRKQLKGTLQIKTIYGHKYAYDAWYDPITKQTKTDYLERAEQFNQDLTKGGADPNNIPARSEFNQVNQESPWGIRLRPLLPQLMRLGKLSLSLSGDSVHVESNLSRQTRYYAGFHSKEERFIRLFVVGRCLHLFSGRSKIGEVRVDVNDHPDCNANYRMNLFPYKGEAGFLRGVLPSLVPPPFNTVILDPLYSENMCNEFAQEYKLDKDAMYCESVYDHPTKETREGNPPESLKELRSEQTRLLYESIRGLNPEIIIHKGWIKAPIERYGYHLLAKYECNIGPRTTTVVRVFVRESRYLDSYLPNPQQEDQAIEALLAHDRAKTLPIKRGEFSEV